MLGHNWFLLLAGPLSSPFLSPAPGVALAYVGLGPGQELIPFFLALLGFVGAALLAIFQWPIAALFRWFSRIRGGRKGEPKDQPMTAKVPESPGEASRDSH